MAEEILQPKNKIGEPMREFDSGATRGDSTGKGRFDLIPYEGMVRLARRFEYGAKRYGDENWKKGIPNSSLMDSAARHLYQYIGGERSEDHLAAAAFNIFALMYNEEHPNKETESK